MTQTPLRRWALAGLAVLGATGALTAPASAHDRRPDDHSKKLTMVFVLDGLRPDSITSWDTPNLFRLREQGVEFAASHSAVPTVTRVNSSVIGTGNQPGTNGIVGNSMYVPEVGPAPFDTYNADQLYKLDDVTGGQMISTTSLGERLQTEGKSVVALGTGSSGSTLLLNPRAPKGIGTMINTGDVTPTRPLAFPASVGTEVLDRFGAPPATGGIDKVDYASRVLREYVLPELQPDVVLNWFTEPDGSEHKFGAGSPEARAAIRNDDRNIGLILDRLRELGLQDRTNLIVASDHGFSLHDANVNVSAELVAAGLKTAPDSDDVVVANTGSVALHVKDHDPAKIRAIVRWLQQQSWADSIYTDRARRGPLARGWVPGTFSLELIHEDHPTRRPDILVTLPWTSKQNAFGLPGTSTNAGGGATGPLTGPGSGHGSFSPWDIHNTLQATGPDFKRGFTDHAPAGNVDITPTILNVLGLGGGERTDGRVLREALRGGPRAVPFRQRTIRARSHGYVSSVTVSEVDGGRYRYVDESRRVK